MQEVWRYDRSMLRELELTAWLQQLRNRNVPSENSSTRRRRRRWFGFPRDVVAQGTDAAGVGRHLSTGVYMGAKDRPDRHAVLPRDPYAVGRQAAHLRQQAPMPWPTRAEPPIYSFDAHASTSRG
jgi:hypothetical protein